MLDAIPEHVENADNVVTDGVIIGPGVHINVNPEDGKHEDVLRNLHVLAFEDPAPVPLGAPQFGLASGTVVLNCLLLKSVFELPRKPTYGWYVVEVVVVMGPYTMRITPVDLVIRIWNEIFSVVCKYLAQFCH